MLVLTKLFSWLASLSKVQVFYIIAIANEIYILIGLKIMEHEFMSSHLDIFSFNSCICFLNL